MKAEMSQEPACWARGNGWTGEGGSQAAIPNCTSNNAGTAGAGDLADVECCLNETTPSSSASPRVNKT